MNSYLDSGFTTPAMAEVWTASNRVSAILEFEAALALSLAEVGLAPGKAVEAVAAACVHSVSDPEAALASTWEAGTPMIAILDEVKQRLANDEERQWVHYGATSQDAIDTAHMLQAGRALDLLELSTTRIARTLRRLMDLHRDQPQIGRTFLQHARPTTFGMRLASWLETALRHLEGLRGVRSALAVQLGGPVGNRIEYGAAAEQVVEGLARRLGLKSSLLAWHAERSRVWWLVGEVQGLVLSMSKIALDVSLLAQSDVAEVTVRGGGSSSMAGKRNPLDSIRALAAAGACRGAAAMITQGRPHELDRAVGSWHLEWFALPLVFQTAAAVLESMERLLDTLEVNREPMVARVPAEDRDVGEAIIRQYEQVAAFYERVVDG